MKLFALTIVALATVCVSVESHSGGGWDSHSGGGWDSHSGGGWGSHSHSHSGGWGEPHRGQGGGWRSTRGPSTTRATTQSPAARVETRTLDQLYQASLAEGGKVIVYAGGDTPGQLDYLKNIYEQQFPNTTLEIIVDYSKYHDGRIQNQLDTNTLVPDVTQLQTLQDFPRWRDEGVLLQYKPRGWDQVYDEFKDPDGYFTGIFVTAFSNLISKTLMPNNATWPTEAQDYLRPEFKDKLVLTYPNDDDAILFWFKKVVDKYGWNYVAELKKQNPTLVRGTQEPSDAIDQNRTPATMAAAGDPSNPGSSIFILPKRDPFMSWAQRAAIFKDAKHPNSAKLYLSWMLDLETQKMAMWTVRKDGPAPAPGLRSIWDYKGQSDPTEFGKWMADRAAVERFKTQLTLYMGEVKGEPSTGHLGLHQATALPH